MDDPSVLASRTVGGPVSVPWAEGVLTRAKELEALAAWVRRDRAEADGRPDADADALLSAIEQHVAAARQAATGKHPLLRTRKAARFERALSNLDAAEAHLLNLAGPSYLVGRLPDVLDHVRPYLEPEDPRRVELQRIAHEVAAIDADGSAIPEDERVEHKRTAVDASRSAIVTALRAASSAATGQKRRAFAFMRCSASRRSS